MSKQDPCEFCTHRRDRHCVGGVEHTHYKDEMKQNGVAGRVHRCVSQHCLEPLCCCLDFMEPALSDADLEALMEQA